MFHVLACFNLSLPCPALSHFSTPHIKNAVFFAAFCKPSFPSHHHYLPDPWFLLYPFHSALHCIMLPHTKYIVWFLYHFSYHHLLGPLIICFPSHHVEFRLGDSSGEGKRAITKGNQNKISPTFLTCNHQTGLYRMGEWCAGKGRGEHHGYLSRFLGWY